MPRFPHLKPSDLKCSADGDALEGVIEAEDQRDARPRDGVDLPRHRTGAEDPVERREVEDGPRKHHLEDRAGHKRRVGEGGAVDSEAVPRAPAEQIADLYQQDRRGRDPADQGDTTNLAAVDSAPTAEDPAELVTDKGYFGRAVLKSLDDSPGKTPIAESQGKWGSRWDGDETPASTSALSSNNWRGSLP